MTIIYSWSFSSILRLLAKLGRDHRSFSFILQMIYAFFSTAAYTNYLYCNMCNSPAAIYYFDITKHNIVVALACVQLKLLFAKWYQFLWKTTTTTKKTINNNNICTSLWTYMEHRQWWDKIQEQEWKNPGRMGQHPAQEQDKHIQTTPIQHHG